MYCIRITEYFKRQLRQSLKKNRHLKRELWHALLNFDKRLSTPLGKDLYKIRLPGWNRGKSGGYQLYIYMVEIWGLITPVYIHSKKERDTISREELTVHMVNVERELRVLFA